MARPKAAVERELVKEQLTQAKKTLARLREISESPRNGDATEWERRDSTKHASIRFPNVEVRNGTPDSNGSSCHPRISTAARDNLVHALGYQVSKLEDDLKDSLLSYFEQVEKQKEDLIDSFNIMQQQLLRHQQICQEQTQEATEKDHLIQKLKNSKRDLQLELERLKSENERNAFDCSSILGLDSSVDSLPESFGLNSPNNSEYSSEKSDISEKLFRENNRLRGLLRQQDNLDSSRLERKVDLQEKLCHSYDKDVASKELLIKRLKAENKGLQSDVQSLQDEVLRVNASRLNAEQDRTRLQQEIQYVEEQFMVLREKLAEALNDKEDIKKYLDQSKYQKANDSSEDIPSFSEDEIVQLQNKCDSYKDKINDRERCISAMRKDTQELEKTLDTLKKDLSAAKNEAHRMKRENERLQRENADRDIDRLSTESSAKASNSRINKLKDKIADTEVEVRDLQRKCQELEQREADLNHDVLANLEKYTQTEQELYATKKELAQLRSFYESSEKREHEMQNDLLSAREKLARLEKDRRLAKDSRILHSNGVDVEDLESENRRLKEDIARLDDALNSSKMEQDEFEHAMESLREQISIQKVRLDGNETMIMRKNERIKELQDELLDLHNQNDALTDEILRRNRENESLKMGKLLAEQEKEVLKHGKFSVRGSHPSRDSLLFPRVQEPSTPDSGFSEIDGHPRGKSAEHLRKDMGDNREFYPRQPSQARDVSSRDPNTDRESQNGIQQKLTNLTEENTLLKDQEVELAAIINDMQAKLSDVQQENQQLCKRQENMERKFGDKESSAFQKELSELQEENSELREKEKHLEEALEQLSKQSSIANPEVTLLDQLDALESAPVQDLWDFGVEDSHKKKSIHPNEVQLVEDRRELVSYGETPLERTEVGLLDTPNDDAGVSDEMSKELEELKDDIKNYEKQVEDLTDEKQELQTDLEETREMLVKAEKDYKISEQERDNMQENKRKDTAEKNAKLAELQKELNLTNKSCHNLKSQVEKMKGNSADAEDKLRSSQGKCSELESKVAEYKKKLKEMEDLVEKAKEDKASLVTELNQAKSNIIYLENEANELQSEEKMTIDKCRELQRDKRNLEEDIQLLEKDKTKLEKKLKELEEEQDEISQKWEDTKRNMKDMKTEQRRLQEEKEDMDFEHNETLKQKNRELKNLTNDLETSVHKIEELKSIWNNSEMMSSDLKSELLKAKEECIDLSSKNEKLYDLKKELVKELEDREKVIDSLRNAEEEFRNGINNREKELEKLRDKLKERKEETEVLREEGEELRNVIELTNEKQKEVDSFVKKMQDDKVKAENQVQVSQEIISDLEKAFEKSKLENALLKEKLNKADRKISELQKREDNAQSESMEAEKRAKTAEKKVKELNGTVSKCNEDNTYMKNKLAKAESAVASLEEANSKNEEQQKVLQRKLLEANNQISELDGQEQENQERQWNNDKRIADLRQYNEEVEAERDDFEYKVKDFKKKLEKERKRVDALEDELTSKQIEKDVAVQKLGLLKSNLSETEYEQNAHLTDKEKLKKDMLEASKRIMDLEAESDSQRENIEELEKMLDQKRATVLDMEDKLKDMSESVSGLQTQHEEDKRMLRTLNEDNANLEKMLEKQKQLSEGYKSTLSQKDTEIAKITFSRDDTEDALLLMKKDLARRDGVNKANQEELEDVEKQLATANKKLQETKLVHENVLQENERLQKEITKKKLAEIDGLQEDSLVNALELEPLYSRKSSGSSVGFGTADVRIKTLDDKLSKAQNKVTDLESSLSKEIRRHEIDCIKTRPSLPYMVGKRTGFYDVSGMGTKYGTRRSDSSDSELSSSAEDGKYRASYRRRKSVDSTEESMDRGSDVESKGSDRSIKPMSATTPQTLATSKLSYDLPINQDKMESLTIREQPDESVSSRDEEDTDDNVFNHSVGNLNDLISEFNEAEKQDPLLEKYLLDQSQPDGSSTPHNDSFDLIQPTYVSRKDESSQDLFQVQSNELKPEVIAPPSEHLLDFGSFDGASDITTVSDVTAISKPVKDQLLLDLDPFSGDQHPNTNHEKTNPNNKNPNPNNENATVNSGDSKRLNLVNEEPGVFARDSPNDVIDPFSVPFDIPNWDEEFDSSFDAELTKGTTDMEQPVKILINDREYEGGDSGANAGEITPKEHKNTESSPDEATHSEYDIDSDILVELEENNEPGKSDLRGNQKELPDRFTEIRVGFAADTDEEDQKPDYNIRDVVRHTAENEQKNTTSIEKAKAQGYRESEHVTWTPQDTQTQSNKKIYPDDEKTEIFRKPKEIIRQMEESSFKVGKPGMRPRPKQRLDQVEDSWSGNDYDVDHENEVVKKPEPKPRGKQGTVQYGNMDRVHEGNVDDQQIAPIPKERSVRLKTHEENEHEENVTELADEGQETETPEEETEDRRTLIGRQRVLNLIAAFEGKEV